MSKPTPGPWKVAREPWGGRCDYFVIRPEDDSTICEVFQKPMPANARLIAAAPELLAACKSAEESIVSFMGVHGYGAESVANDILTEIRAAIAKAEGKE